MVLVVLLHEKWPEEYWEIRGFSPSLSAKYFGDQQNAVVSLGSSTSIMRRCNNSWYAYIIGSDDCL